MSKPMTEPEVIRLARENVEAYSTGDWQRLRAALASDVIYDEVGTQRRLQGVEQMVEAYQTWKNAIPDGKGTVTTAFASGNSVLIEVTWSGTQTGPLMGPSGIVPPSGKTINVRGAQVIIVEAGKIRELHQHFDLLTLLQQIGAAPK